MNLLSLGLGAALEQLVDKDVLSYRCKVSVADVAGRTKCRRKFGFDFGGNLVMGVHNSKKPDVCVTEGIIPVTKEEPPSRVPVFAVALICAGKVVFRNNK